MGTLEEAELFLFKKEFVKADVSGDNRAMAQVILEHVSKSFGETAVIKDLSLTVKDHEFVVLVGPSGCGKSTVLRMIAGLESANEGDIQIGGHVVNDVSPKDRDIAMVFQNYALYPHMSVFDNMAFGLKMRKVPKPEIQKRVASSAKILDLENLLQRKPKQLSGGQRQRVALGRAIVRDPQVFLMDEPLSNLDAKLRVSMRREIAQLHQRLNATTIYVTHDQVEAMTMGDRIVILHEGVIQQMDTPTTVYEQPANLFVAGFIGQMNFIKGERQGNQFVFDGGTLVLPHAFHSPEKAPVILGIRPEHFSFLSTSSTSSISKEPESQHSPQKAVTSVEIVPEQIEILGSEKLVHFQLGGSSMTARLSPDVAVAIEQKISLNIDLTHVSLFDAQTEKRLF